MKSHINNTIALFWLSSLVSNIECHTVSGHLIVNGTDTGLYKHVLNVAPDEKWGLYEYSKGEPIYSREIFGEGIHNMNWTCGRLAFNSMNATEIADVVAGEEVGFQTWNKQDAGGSGTYFPHAGPAQVYLSRAPNDDLRSYRGEGDWFKIAWTKPTTNTDWPIQGKNGFNFTIPKTTPPGKYLLRFEFIYAQSEVRPDTQFYVNCALVNIMGPGGGTPSGFERFPVGSYRNDGTGIWIPWNQNTEMMPDREYLRLLEYVPPGPAVWTG